MGTGMHKLIVIGTVVAALGLVGPAFGKPALPEGYQLPSAEPSAYSPQAVKALGERGQLEAQLPHVRPHGHREPRLATPRVSTLLR